MIKLTNNGMHSTEVVNGNVPAFLVKLWKLVDDSTCDDLISWNQGGTSFIIHDQARFAKELLPLYFKHSNTASFIRQLNMYGFKKVLSLEQGGLKSDGNSLEFQHPYFIMGNEHLLEIIKRKVAAPKDDVARCKSEILTQVATDLNLLKKENKDLKSQLLQKDHETEVVWRELANLKQKYRNHQQMLNKLFQFLARLVPSNRSLNRGVKRSIPLMIENTSPKKLRRASISTLSDDFSPGNDTVENSPEIRDITDSFSPSPRKSGVESFGASNKSPSSTIGREDMAPPSADLDIDSTLNIGSSVFDPLIPNEDAEVRDANEILSEITSEFGMTNDAKPNRASGEHDYSQVALSRPGTSGNQNAAKNCGVQNKGSSQPTKSRPAAGSLNASVEVPSSIAEKEYVSPPSADLDIDSTLNIGSSVFDPLIPSDDTDVNDANDILSEITCGLGIGNCNDDKKNDTAAEHDYSQVASPGPSTSGTQNLATSQSSCQNNDRSVAIIDAPLVHIPEDSNLKDLEWLKDQLMNAGGYNIDPSYFLNLFSQADACKANTLNLDDMLSSIDPKNLDEVQGNELVQFNQPVPDLSLFDMESALQADSDLNPEFDELFGVTDAPLNTPEITDKRPKFSVQSKTKSNGKGSKKVKTYSSSKNSKSK